MALERPPGVLNLNQEVWVKLTFQGHEAFHEYCHANRLPASTMLNYATRSGWWRFPLWQLMAIFGPAMMVGMGNVPFEGNNIRTQPPQDA